MSCERDKHKFRNYVESNIYLRDTNFEETWTKFANKLKYLIISRLNIFENLFWYLSRCEKIVRAYFFFFIDKQMETTREENGKKEMLKPKGLSRVCLKILHVYHKIVFNNEKEGFLDVLGHVFLTGNL